GLLAWHPQIGEARKFKGQSRFRHSLLEGFRLGAVIQAFNETLKDMMHQQFPASVPRPRKSILLSKLRRWGAHFPYHKQDRSHTNWLAASLTCSEYRTRAASGLPRAADRRAFPSEHIAYAWSGPSAHDR